ncbi:hypothetical protein D3C81_2086950 [compost metagenome]
MIPELIGAEGIGDSFDGILDGMGKIIGRIYAPAASGTVMLRMDDPVENRVPEIDVGGGHIDFGPEHLGRGGMFTPLHFLQQGQIFFG